MADLVQPTLDGAAGWLLTYLAHSAVLLVGAWVMARLLPSRPAAREVVWRVALLGGVVTATGVGAGSAGDVVATPIRTLAFRGVDAEARIDGAGPLDSAAAPGFAVRPPGYTAPEGIVATGRARTLRLRALTVERAGDPGGERRGALHRIEAAGAPPPSADCRRALRSARVAEPGWSGRVEDACGGAPLGWYHLLVPAWLVGALLGAFRLLCRRRSLADLEATLGTAGARATRLLVDMEHGTEARLVVSDALSAPCVLPGARIALPRRCERELSDGELRAVLAHELAHVHRRDVAWSTVLRAFVAVLWIQPLNALALRGALGAAEEICDDWALRRTGERVGLATSIARVAEWARRAPPDPVPVSMAGRRDGPVSARVRRILFGAPRAEPRWLGLAAAAIVAAPLLWVPSVQPRDPAFTAVWLEEQAVTGFLSAPVEGGASTEVEVRVTRIDMR